MSTGLRTLQLHTDVGVTMGRTCALIIHRLGGLPDSLAQWLLPFPLSQLDSSSFYGEKEIHPMDLKK